MRKILIYDLRSIPNGLDIDDVISEFEDNNVIIWDSFSGGKEPKIIEVNE